MERGKMKDVQSSEKKDQ